MSRIAFYATIKPPDHHIASGDRLIANNLIKALEVGGHTVELASRFIAYSKRPALEILQERKNAALEEAAAIVDRLRHNPPDVWITYHPYCKAPDWVGAFVCQKLDIPYVNIEAAKTGQGFENGGDLWARWRQEAQRGIKQADLHIAFKPTDMNYLRDLLGGDETIRDLAPFMDIEQSQPVNQAEVPNIWRKQTPTLIAVGMMRPGKKLKNYEILCDALKPLQSLHWNLIIIGDGPEEERIKQTFSIFDPSRILFTGALPHENVLAFMRRSDLFVWPGWKEPIGMVYLEAQLMGLPVAALDSMGVSLTVQHGKTGLLAPETALETYSQNLTTLISHPKLRMDFGECACLHIHKHHSLTAAARRLNEILIPLIGS